MFKNVIINVVLLWLVSVCDLRGQATKQRSGNEMDFWVGEWNLEWTINGEKGTGSNSVTKTLGGAVLHEHFRGREGPYAGFNGESFTVFNPKETSFFQTWVDNEGGYLDFTFDTDEDKYIFIREVETEQGISKARMIFYDIKPNQFTWDWQRYNNESQEWELQWRIFYTRKENLDHVELKQFAWLTGRWKNEDSGSYEVWTFSEDQSALNGYSVQYNTEGDSTITERLSIKREGDILTLTAQPASSNTATDFQIISATDNNFVCYNPNHDFPQRIEYHRLSPQKLKAVIKNENQRAEFLFFKEEEK